MAHRNLMIRFFFVGEDDSLHRIPVARYERIFNRAQPITLYAGKSLRFVEAVVERDDDGMKSWLMPRSYDINLMSADSGINMKRMNT
jgi:hypothetical protein